jgi:hypothetical protein
MLPARGSALPAARGGGEFLARKSGWLSASDAQTFLKATKEPQGEKANISPEGHFFGVARLGHLNVAD